MRLKATLVAVGLLVAAPTLSRAQIPQALVDHQPSIAITEHTGVFGEQTVPYTAIVEEHILRGPDSIPNAFLVTIAYVRDDVEDPTTRPVMFAFNGGPGASSSPLHMNGIGPRMRTPDGIVDNPNSILDTTDLVFIDPVGTGFSRPYTTEVGREFYWNTAGDAASVKQVIDIWLQEYGRESSPRYIAGESYGTSRIGLIFKNHKDARFDGVLMVAVVAGQGTCREIPYVTALPTMATSAWYHEVIPRNGRTVTQVYDEAVDFARTEYLTALVRGSSLPGPEKTRIADRMSSLVGLPAQFIDEKDLRLSKDDWMLNVLKDRNLRTGMLDTRVTAERDTTRTGGLADPSLGGGRMQIGTAMLAPAIVPGTQPPAPIGGEPTRQPSDLENYLKEDLQFSTPETYRSLNLDINGVWDHGNFGDAAAAVAEAMHANPEMRLFWTGGYYDLTTPAYLAQYSFDQAGVPADRTTAALIPGPHSVFSDEVNKAQLAGMLRAWIGSPRRPTP